MGRKRSYTPLNVFLNSRLVGQLVREPSGGVSFSYVPAWLDWEHRMPVSLSLPLQETRYSGAPEPDRVYRRRFSFYSATRVTVFRLS
jgi:serine/threonine-protein kinase HipA